MKSYILNLLLVSFIFVGCNKSNDDENEETTLPFTVTSYSPQQGKVDATVTINGNNFSTTISEITVTFNGIEASVISATETEIKTVVPSSLPIGDADIVLKINNETKPVGNFTVSIDDYRYLVFSSYQNKIYSFGNNSGDYQELGMIKPIGINGYMMAASISNSPTKIYTIVANTSTPSNNSNQLIIYDKISGVTTVETLNLPSSIKGPHQVILGMAWDSDNNRLVAVLTPDLGSYFAELYVIFINPVDFEVIDSGIITPSLEPEICSFLYTSNRIYFSGIFGSNFIDINLQTGISQIWNFENPPNRIWRISKSNQDAILYAFRFPGGTNAIIPIELDLMNNIVTDLSPYNHYSLSSFNGNGFYDSISNQSVQLIRDNNGGHSLYKFNENSEILINTSYLDSGYGDNFLILGIIE